MSAQPWWQITKPHKDIREGRLDESVFAADLAGVVEDRGPIEYRDPETFFRRTYVTAGLRNILQSVVSRLAGVQRGGAAPGVIQLETPFGGGKTHALLALYHLLQNRDTISHIELAQEICESLDLKELPRGRVAAFVGTEADVLKGRTPWGEIAEQLGQYDMVKEHDERRVSPGKGNLEKIVRSAAPCLILIDELLEYTVKAAAASGTAGGLFGNVLAFVQELTEVLSKVENAAMVLTLPSSLLERYDEAADRALAKLQKISGRVETIYTPVEGEEVYEVIRRRLFEDLGPESARKLVADEYFEMYQGMGEDIPSEFKEITYRQKMAKAYPFHPELIDLLYERWGSYATFQRTRGVLRLLGNVLADLLKKEHKAPMIQPAHVDLGSMPIRREFIKHIGNKFESVIAADIVGAEEKAARIDHEMGTEYTQHRVATGLATSIFLYSFSEGGKKGVSLQRLRIALLRQGIPPTIVGDAVKRLEDELWYLHTEDSRFYFSDVPNLNRVILHKEEAVGDERIEAEILERIAKDRVGEMDMLPWPSTDTDIPDNKRMKLVVLPATYPIGGPETDSFLTALVTRYGAGFRTFKNVVLFLIPEGAEYENLKRAVRRYLALKDVRSDSGLAKTFTEENQKSLEQKLKDADAVIGSRLLTAYRHLAKASGSGIREFDMGLPTLGEKPSLSKRVLQYLHDEEIYLSHISTRALLDKTFAPDQESQTFGSIAEAFLKFPDLPIITNQEDIRRSVALGVANAECGLQIGDTVYFKEHVFDSIITSEAQVLKPELAEERKRATQPRELEGTRGAPDTYQERKAATQDDVEGAKKVEVHEIRGAKQIRIRAEVPWDKLSSLISGVLSPLHQEGATVKLQVDVLAESEKGISHNTLDLKIKETLTQIGAKILEWPTEP